MKRYLLLLAVALLTACSSSETLLRDLSERDANEIIAVLYANQISSEKTVDSKGKSFSVLVKKAELAPSVSVLRSVGLPRESHPNLNDIFKSNGFAPTSFEEKVRFAYGTAQELERTISYIDGVLAVRVHVVMPDKVSRHEAQNPPSASVFVNYDDKVNFDLQIPRIRRLIADSIEGLDGANVNILATATQVDLTKIAGTPLTSFLGMKVKQESVPLLSFFMVLFLLMAGGLVYALRKELLAAAKRLKKHD